MRTTIEATLVECDECGTAKVVYVESVDLLEGALKEAGWSNSNESNIISRDFCSEDCRKLALALARSAAEEATALEWANRQIENMRLSNMPPLP